MSDERNNLPSASGLPRINLCPGSWLAERGLPDESTPDAQIGDRVHAALCAGTSKGLAAEEVELYDACKAGEDWAVASFTGTLGLSRAPVEIIREERLWSFDSAFKKSWSGKADLIYLWEKHAIVIDYKTGRDPVPTKDNLQLQALAALVYESYGCDTIGVKIVQPHAPKDNVVIYTRGDLDKFSIENTDMVWRAQQPGGALIPSEAACRYCKARSQCPAALNVVETLPANVPKQSGEIMLTPERIAKVLDAARVAEDVIESVRSKAKRMLEAGIVIPGWKLKPGAVKESIVDVPALFSRFSALGGTQEQFIGTVTVAKTRLKDAVRAVTATNGKAPESHMDTLLDGITESKQNQPSLVKEIE